jgi:hypothetical protein
MYIIPLNLLDKPDRIALFQAVLYGNPDREAVPALIDLSEGLF